MIEKTIDVKVGDLTFTFGTATVGEDRARSLYIKALQLWQRRVEDQTDLSMAEIYAASDDLGMFPHIMAVAKKINDDKRSEWFYKLSTPEGWLSWLNSQSNDTEIRDALNVCGNTLIELNPKWIVQEILETGDKNATANIENHKAALLGTGAEPLPVDKAMSIESAVLTLEQADDKAKEGTDFLESAK